MKMQDNEFDKLFKSKLDDYEPEPSKAVWQGVKAALGNPNRKKLIPFLSIAASIMIFITAALLMTNHGVDRVKPRLKTQVAVKKQLQKDIHSSIVKQVDSHTSNITLAAQNKRPVLHKALLNNSASPVKNEVMIAKTDAALKRQTPQILSTIVVVKNDVIKHAQMADSIDLTALPAKASHADKPVIAAETATQADLKQADSIPAKKHRIHSFGDVLNVVIAAVDKRKDKVIHFADGDDD